MAQNSSRQILIDTDPGIDDAIAIALALASPEVEVIGITTVGGNTGLAHTTRNALRLLELFGRTDIQVASGHDEPYQRIQALDTATEVHGSDGVGGAELPESTVDVVSTDAVTFLAEKIKSSSQPVTLVTIGPLTNIAHLLDRHPDVISKIDRCIMMGGAAHDGNVTPVAEFNVWHDPEAARRVFHSDLDVIMVGLDATHTLEVPEEKWDWLTDAGKFGAAYKTMITTYTDFYSSIYGQRFTHQHDALAVAEAIWPGTMFTEPAYIDVECDSDLTLGMTVVDTRFRNGQKPNGHVAWGFDVELFENRLMTALQEIAKTIK